MTTSKEANKQAKSAKDLIDELVAAIEDKNSDIEIVNDQLNVTHTKLTEAEDQIVDLKIEVGELREEIETLKLDLLQARNVISDLEHQTLNSMRDSPDSENGILAKEVINKLYNDGHN